MSLNQSILDRADLIDIPHTQRVVGEHFARNWTETPLVHVGVEIDFTQAKSFRDELKDGDGPVPTLMNIIQRAVAQSARDMPIISAMFAGDSRERLHVPKPDDVSIQGPINVDGIAFPLLLKSAGAMTLGEITQLMREKIDKVKRAGIDEAQSKATFMEMGKTPSIGISNIGMLAPITFFTAASMLPSICCIYIGAVIDKPIARENGEIEVAPVATFTMAFDHRALSAGSVAEYMGAVKALIEKPARLI